MTVGATWLAVLGTIAILALYEVALLLARRRNPEGLARSAHAALREEWLTAVSSQSGSEILAVQTLRNSLMSATMTASTAVLGLVGTVTLTTSTLHATFGATPGGAPEFTARLALVFVLMALLFASLVCSAMSVRYYNHAGFIVSMPVGSAQRRRWSAVGTSHLRRAGKLYSWGLRHLVLVGPILAAIVHPAAGPVAALVAVVVLSGFDRIPAALGP
jgi:hypothetical protein